MAVDEEALAQRLPQTQRRAKGIYFSPAPLVDAVVAVATQWLPSVAFNVIDPACGAGAFLAGARRAWPHARLFGADLSPIALQTCAERLPDAQLAEGNSLTASIDGWWPQLNEGSFEAWLGNPPFQGRSSLLDEPALLRALIPPSLRMPSGTSLRDDYVLFLLRATERLRARDGLLAYVTPSSLLDSYAYGPLREYLLSVLSLRHVLHLGPKVFSGAKVATCVTFWTSRRTEHAPRYQSRDQQGAFEARQLQAPRALTPSAPHWLLRPTVDEAEALDAKWRAQGELLETLVPVSLTGLKTRFESLWVDTSRDVLAARVRAFFEAQPSQLPHFAREHGLPEASLSKLAALKAMSANVSFDAANLWPFVVLSAPATGVVEPQQSAAFCYLERRLIPRGDHRFRGVWNPHRHAIKLVFNLRERPLFAFLLKKQACVPAFQHTRFAPLHVPRALLLRTTVSVRTDEEAADEVPNLSAAGLAWAQQLGGATEAFARIARFIASDEVQNVWAPAFATSRVLPIPFKVL